jgi:hypothetical protein
VVPGGTRWYPVVPGGTQLLGGGYLEEESGLERGGINIYFWSPFTYNTTHSLSLPVLNNGAAMAHMI